MIVILEGSNRSGKSTFAEKLKEEANRKGLKCFVYRKRMSEQNEFDTDQNKMFEFMMNMLAEILIESTKNDLVIVDRFHVTEKIYGKIFRGYDNEFIKFLDKLLSVCQAKIIYVFSEYNHINDISKKLEYEKIQDYFISECLYGKYETERTYVKFKDISEMDKSVSGIMRWIYEQI